MEVVAEFLRAEAFRATDLIQKDQFGRSAYNRFYYAAFLIVRETMTILNTAWTKLPHSTYPELLEGAVFKAMNRGRAQARRMDDRELDNLCARGASAARDLARLMREGFATRVVADYRPDIPVKFMEISGFSLNEIDVSQAQTWASRANLHCASVRAAWLQLGPV